MESRLTKLWPKRTLKPEQYTPNNLAAIHVAKTKLKFDKPIYVGMSVLDVSKTLMYKFHYNLMREKCGENIKLLYTDTKSFIYMISIDDFYQSIKDMINYFDTAGYAEKNVYGLPRINRKVLGKMNNEVHGQVMRAMVRLRSKMYATDVDGDEQRDKKNKLAVMKSKGIKRVQLGGDITFDNCKDYLSNKGEKMKQINLIRSYKHEQYTVEVNEKALSPKDDNKHILENGISTLLWGYYGTARS